MKKMMLDQISGLFFIKVICLLATLLCFTGTVQAGIYDDFSGTIIDLNKWDVYINLGPPSQLWQNDGLFYSGSTGNDATSIQTKESMKQISGGNDFVVTIPFTGFSTTTIFPPDYIGPVSGIRISLNPILNDKVISVARVVNPVGDQSGAQNQFAALYQDTSGAVYGFETANTSATSGQLRITYVKGVATVYYNETLDPNTGWHKLADFTPAWEGKSPLLGIGGSDSPNGTTNFEIQNVSIDKISTTSNSGMLLLLLD